MEGKNDLGELSSANIQNKFPSTRINAGSSDPTDGRKRYDWETHYPSKALKIISIEAFYLLVVVIFSVFLLFATWKEWIGTLCNVPLEQIGTLNKYLYYLLSGLLGGLVFDIKYLYRSVARGYWHIDRIYWRILSPVVAMTLSLVVGSMIDASLLSTQAKMSSAAYISIGFLTGYFADNVVGKMYEIATVVFGKSAQNVNGDANQ